MADEREVQYERLRPAQIVDARETTPVAYLPIGTIEWHGEHNPVGLDTLKIHQLAIRCARRTGGLVFPPLYYGESRETSLMEANAEDRERIAEKMGLPPENFAPGYMQTTLLEQTLAYERLLLHCLLEIRSLGFQVVVIAAGHYPLIDHARAAACLFHKMIPRPKTLTWAFTGYELVEDQGYDVCGDHAGKWETSLQMALEPGLQDLDVLGDGSTPPIGVSNNGVLESSAEFGASAVAAIIDRVAPVVQHLLDSPDRYQGHGCPVSLRPHELGGIA